MLRARLPPLRRETNAQLSRSCKLGRGCRVRAHLLAGSVLLPTGSLASAAPGVHFLFIYLAAWIFPYCFYYYFSRASSPEFYCVRAGLQRGRGEAEPSRASCPGPRPRIGLPGPAPAAGWPRGRGVAGAAPPPPRRAAGGCRCAAAGQRREPSGRGREREGERRSPGPEGRGEGGEARRSVDVKECARPQQDPRAWDKKS